MSNSEAEAQAVEFASKNWVWVPDKEKGFIKGFILDEYDDNLIKIRCLDDSDRTVDKLIVDKVNPPKFDKADDMAQLTYLNEASVVHNLSSRYDCNLIYTYSGLFLVAINPYCDLPIYNDETINYYRNKTREDSKPHIFAITDLTFRNMIEMNENQSILVTGESGAGKTENTKKIIQYLAAITKDNNSRPLSISINSNSNDFENSTFEQQILQANPILESFGNAQTVRNNNSSRFGKFIRIEFNRQGIISGAYIDWYLLEKSRVIYQNPEERNYHIFYQLIAGAPSDLKNQLLMSSSPNNYVYLKYSNKIIKGVNDTEEYKSLLRSFSIMGFTKSEYIDIFKVISAILKLGNIDVGPERYEQARITDRTEIEKVCHLLGLNVDQFISALINPKVKAGREWVVQSRSPQQAKHSLDALAKGLYERTFKGVVDKINNTLVRSDDSSSFIGVLDIAGFEIFEVNSFEQLCINYTNERLQQFFNHHMFVLEQEEYNRENIEWNFIDFGLDLQPTINLIEKSNPIGIFSCLDEDCVVPRATDKSFTEKLNSLWDGKSPKYKASRLKQGFTLTHYASDVEYSTEGWLEKNKDPMNDNIIDLLVNSSDRHVAELFEKDGSIYKASGSTVKKGLFRTVAQKHKEQLLSLMNQLELTHPHFVRCIIPNHQKRPKSFDSLSVLEQLRCNGVLEGIRIARSGYPNRLLFSEFKTRYQCLATNLPKGYTEGRKACGLILESIKMDEGLYLIGLTKVFFKAGVLADLENQKEEMVKGIISKFQAIVRAAKVRYVIQKSLYKSQATQIIMRNFEVYNTIKHDSWWKLFVKMKPLLNTSREISLAKVNGARIKKLEAEIKNIEDERDKLESASHKAELEVRKLNDTLESERSLAEDQDVILERAKSTEADLEEQLANTLDDLDHLEDEIDELLIAKKKAEETADTWRAELENGANIIAKLEKEKNELINKISDLEHELEDTMKDQITQENTAESLAEEINTLKQESDEKDKIIIQLEHQLDESNRGLEEELAAMEDDCEEAQAKFEELSEENNDIRNQLSELYQTSSDFEVMIQKKETELAKLNYTLKEQEKEYRSLDKETSQLQVESESKEQELQNTKSEIAALRDRLRTLEEDSNEAQDLLQATINDKSKYEKNKKFLEKQIETLTETVNSLQDEIQYTQTENVDFINEKDSKINSLQQQVRELKQGIDKLKNEKAEDAKNTDNLTRDKRKALDQVENLTVQIKNLKAKIEENNSSRGEASEAVRKLRTQLSKVSSRALDFEDKLNIIRIEKERMMIDYKSMKSRFSEQSFLINHNGSEKTKLSSELASYKTKITTVIAQKERIAKELAERSKKLDELRKEYDENANLRNEEEENDRISVEQDERRMKTEYEKLNDEYAALEANRDKLVREDKDLQHEVDREQNSARRAEYMAESLEKQLSQLQAEKSSAELENQNHRQELSKLKKELKNKVKSRKSISSVDNGEAMVLKKKLEAAQKESEKQKGLLESQITELNKRWKQDIVERDRPRVVSRGYSPPSPSGSSVSSISFSISPSPSINRLNDESFKTRLEESEQKCLQLSKQLRTLLAHTGASQKENISPDRSTLESAHQELIKVYQEVSRKLSISKSELAQCKTEILSLTLKLGENEKRLIDWKSHVGPEFASALAAKEELTDVRFRMDALQATCDDLAKSYKLYKGRADEYYSRLESAEVAVLKSSRAAKFAKSKLTETENALQEAKNKARESETEVSQLVSKIRKLDDALEDCNIELQASLDSQKAYKSELEDYRRKDLKGDDMLSSAKQKYQQEIESLTNELNKERQQSKLWVNQSDDLTQEINDLKSELDRRRQHSQSWLQEKQQLELKVSELKEANRKEIKDRGKSEKKMGDLLSQVRNLRAGMDDLTVERDKLQDYKRELEGRVTEMTSQFEELFSDTSNGDANRADEKLSNDALSIKAALDQEKRETVRAIERLKQYKRLHEEASNSVYNEKEVNAQLSQEKVNLSSENEELKLKISELEKKMASTDKRGYQYWQTKINDLEKKIEEVNRLRVKENRSSRNLDNVTRDLQDQLAQKNRRVQRLDEDLKKKGLKITNLVEQIDKLEGSESYYLSAVKSAEKEKQELNEKFEYLEKEIEEWKTRFANFTSKRSSGNDFQPVFT